MALQTNSSETSIEALFAFVKDARLNKAVIRDFQELNICAQHGATKAAMILGGSIIEAVLLDHLKRPRRKVKAEAAYSTIYHGKSKKLGEMGLDDLLKVAGNMNLLPPDAIKLCDLVKDYRNLVHPGRELRFPAAVDSDRSQLVGDLVRIVVRGLSQRDISEGEYGAEHVVAALINDENATNIIDHLVTSLSPRERNKLLPILSRILARIDTAEVPWWAKESLRKCYRVARQKADGTSRRRVLTSLIDTMKRGEDNTVRNLFENCFDAADLTLLQDDEQLLVFDYYFKAFETAKGDFKDERTTLQPLSKFGSFVPVIRRPKFFDDLLDLIAGRYVDSYNYIYPLRIFEAASQGVMRSDVEQAIDRRIQRETQELENGSLSAKEPLERLKNLQRWLGLA